MGHFLGCALEKIREAKVWEITSVPWLNEEFWLMLMFKWQQKVFRRVGGTRLDTVDIHIIESFGVPGSVKAPPAVVEFGGVVREVHGPFHMLVVI